MASPPETIELSLNEIESLAQKAARGAGLSWGLAEDAGRSAAWLAAHLGAWAGTLLDLLDTPPEAAHSPLLLGPYLADMAPEPAELARVMAPIWLLPPLLIGPGRRRPVQLRLGAEAIGGGPGATAGATLPFEAWALLPPRNAALVFAPASWPHALPARFGRGTLALPLFHRLEALAARTYVPASEASRRTGAGAGLLDDE